MLLAFKIGNLLGLAGVLQWIIIYTRLEPWWRSSIGRTLVMLASMVLAQQMIFALSLFLDFNRLTSQVASWVYIIIVYLIGIGMFHRSIIWIRAARKGTTGTLPAGKPDPESGN
jgi:hypothetical protein